MFPTLAVIALLSGTAEASDERRQDIDIAASTLRDAIAELSREANVSIGTDGSLPALPTRAIHDRLSVRQALDRLLAGSGYRARKVGETAWRIEKAGSGTAQLSGWRAGIGAQAGAAAETVAIEPIVVTGAKRDQSLYDLPMAVTIAGLTEQQRHDVGSDTATIAGDMEGLALTSLGPGRNRIFLRGISDSPFNGESQSTVAVVLDETRVTYAAPDPDIRLIDVERVEVLKGPQGSLYGIGALGGIYHLVTRRADLDDTTLSTSAGTEIVARGGAGISGSAIGNLPLLPGVAALRLVGYTAKEPGWVDTGDQRDTNSSRLTGARAGLGIDPGGGWRLDVTGFAQWLESRDSRYVYKSKARSRPEQIAEPHDNDLRHLSARLAGHAGGADIVASSGISWHEVGDTLDATIGAESFGLADPRELEDSRHYRVWDSELRASGTWNGLDWLAGLSHVEARQSHVWTLASRSGAELVIDDDRRTAYDTAAFADLTLPLSATFRINAGTRVFRAVLKETRNVPAGTVTREQHRSGMTPSLALAWRPSPDRLVFLRYGSAFRQGGADIAPDGELETLKGDELAMIEAGWREQFGARGRLDVGAWYAWWQNVQSDLLQSDGLIETENAGDARIFGAEASIELALSSAWRVEGGANVTFAKLVSNTLGIELPDRHLPAVPEYTVRAALRHDFRIGSGDAWLRGRLRYVGPSRLSFDPVLDRPMGKVLETRLEGHAAFGRLELAIAAENLLVRKSDAFAYGNSLRFAEMRQFTPQQPLTLSLSVVRKF